MSIPDIPVFDDALLPKDERPETSHELTCRTCGVELTYSGRGRKPVYCDKHRKSGSGTGRRTASENIGKNEQLAAQAAEALVSVNTIAEMGLRVTKMTMTAEALAMAKDGFREAVFEALKTDPELCRTILRGGVQSGRIQLIIAYGMLASVVAPVATMEIKSKRREVSDDETRSESDGATLTA